jgi:hypothetical protein
MFMRSVTAVAPSTDLRPGLPAAADVREVIAGLSV